MTFYTLEVLGLMVVAFALGFAGCYLFALYLVRQEHRELEDVLERSRNASWYVNGRNQK